MSSSVSFFAVAHACGRYRWWPSTWSYESITTEAGLNCALGPGIPEPSQERVPASDHRHKLPAEYRVGKTPVLGGLHHGYHQVKEAA